MTKSKQSPITTPVLAIGVLKEYRNKAVGTALIEAMKQLVTQYGITEISLCVTKSNVALKLYEKHKFRVVEDLGDSCNMIWSAND